MAHEHRSPDVGRPRLADSDGLLRVLLAVPPLVYVAVVVAGGLGLAVAFAVTGFAAAGENRSLLAAVLDTLIVTAGATAAAVPAGLLLAWLFTAGLRARWLLRCAGIVPLVAPLAVSALAWRWILASSPVHGRVPVPALAAVAGVEAWRTMPLVAVVLVTAGRRISPDIGEAAHLDGAGVWRRTVEVALPLRLPGLALAAVLVALFAGTDATAAQVLAPHAPVLPSLAVTAGLRDGKEGAALALFLLPGTVAALLAVRRRVGRS